MLSVGTSRAGSSPSSPGVPRARVRSRVLAGAVAARAPLLCATSHRTSENIYRCSRYMASGNKSTIFIFKRRVFDSCFVVSKGKGSVQRHPDSSGLESARVSWRLEPSRAQVRIGLESSSLGVPRAAREQH